MKLNYLPWLNSNDANFKEGAGLHAVSSSYIRQNLMLFWIFFVLCFHFLLHPSISFVCAPSASWSMWCLRMNGQEMERTGKVVKFPQDGVVLVRRPRGLGALSPPPSLCPSLTGWLSDMAVILSHPFICLPNGNPLFSLHLQLFFSFFFASVPFFILRLPLWHSELWAVLLIWLRNPHLNNDWRRFI